MPNRGPAYAIGTMRHLPIGDTGGLGMATVRYLVSDVDAAVAFYTTMLECELEEQFGPAMAIVRRGDLTLWLAGPTSSAARPMPDGRSPEPGGWNRFVFEVDDLAATVERLRAAGVSFRNEIVTGPGGRQILVDDPSGNPIELFQPLRKLD
jgi:catechol 2,3-dioxygenase-like lactoylglutathione lyase family enzyme